MPLLKVSDKVMGRFRTSELTTSVQLAASILLFFLYSTGGFLVAVVVYVCGFCLSI